MGDAGEVNRPIFCSFCTNAGSFRTLTADLCTRIGEIHRFIPLLHLFPQIEQVHTPIQLVTR